MKRIVGVLLLTIYILCGCALVPETENKVYFKETELVYEEELSPNENYIEHETEKVFYNIKIYQNENCLITVVLNSNSGFFEETYYQIECVSEVVASDIEITWTTLMGNPECAEDDQYALAQIAISVDGELISEKKVNFITGAVKTMFEIIEQNQK